MTPEKTTLIIPPSPFLADQRVFPFLGILKVAASLKEKGQDVDVLDLSGISNYPDVVKDYLEVNKGSLRIGITATTPQFPDAVKITQTIRSRAPEAKILLGGTHATLVGSARELDKKKGSGARGTRAYNQMLEIFDTIVLGDGENAIFEAIKDDAPPVIDASSPKSEHYLKRGTLDKYPFPARELIDMDSYHYRIDGLDAQSLIAQLGCPFECGFCGGRNTYAFRVTRTRSVESILDEVDVLAKKYGKHGIMFYDDELNVNNDSLLELLNGLVKYQQDNNLNLRLRGFVKAELFSAEQAKMMYLAGFRDVLSGVESGDRTMLDTMRKHTTPEINSLWIRLCHEAGLRAKALMSIGHPGESRKTIENSLEWVIQNKPDDIDWTIITQYPGTPYFDQSIPHPTKPGVWVYTEPRSGNVLYSQDVNFAQKAEYYKGVPGDYTSYVWTESLSPEDLVEGRDNCEKVSRVRLGLAEIRSVPAQLFENSMGQGRILPKAILRQTSGLDHR